MLELQVHVKPHLVFGYFDKKAVQVGGGESHRMRLDDMVLIKDNHLFFSDSVEKSVRKAKKEVGSTVKIECEVTKCDDAIRAIIDWSRYSNA